MTDEERQRQMDFIINQQAQLTVTVGQLAEKVDHLAEKVDHLAGSVDRIAEKVDRTADSVIALLAIAEIHDQEIKETDERLNALINIVERHISEGRNGKG
jgi:ABC-type transporter Mla subunit MlaD